MTEQTATHRALIDATIESIHRHGLTGTTVSTVTQIAGLSRGMVRHVFSSKQDMLRQTLETLRIEWTAATEPPSGLPPLRQLESIICEMFSPDVFRDAEIDAWLALSQAARTDGVLRAIRERAYAAWTRQLTDALTAAGADGPDRVATAILALADGLWLRHSLEPARMPRERAEAIALHTVRRVVSDLPGPDVPMAG